MLSRTKSALFFQPASIFLSLVLVMCMITGSPVIAQEIAEDSLLREDDPEALLLAELEQAKKKKTTEKTPLKQPKNIFYGTKIKKNFIKSYTSAGTEIEIFYHVQDHHEANPYLKNVQEIVWFNPHKRALQKTLDIDKQDMRLLHGPYKKLRNGKVITEGYYFMGGKHGRWETYDDHYILKDKTKFYHGWPKESQFTYYDADRKKLKEVVPIHYGEKHGMYYAFYEGGQRQSQGRYEHNYAVGTWYEYYQFGRYSQSKKKEIRYPRRAFDKTEPVVVREWDDKGKVVYDLDKDGEKVSKKVTKEKAGEEEADEKF